GIDSKRGGYAIRTNHCLSGFSDVITRCSGIAVSERNDTTDWRRIAQCHCVLCGGIAFYDIRWTSHGHRNGIF
ncbi:hypothetical protein D046_8339B, partial [Vibrio parahaemolyticus V-223/04]